MLAVDQLPYVHSVGVTADHAIVCGQVTSAVVRNRARYELTLYTDQRAYEFRVEAEAELDVSTARLPFEPSIEDAQRLLRDLRLHDVAEFSLEQLHELATFPYRLTWGQSHRALAHY